MLERLAGLFETLAETAQLLTDKLATIGEGAFSALLTGAERAETVMSSAIEQANAVGAAWDRAAAAAARYGEAASAGGGSGGGGAGGRRGPRVPTQEDEIRAARRNAEAENANLDYITQGTWMNARAENANFDAVARERLRQERGDTGGLYGPGPRPYFGDGDDFANARAENANFDAVARERLRRERENSGLYGPSPRPYWGEGDDFANAAGENMRYDAAERERARRARRGPDESFDEPGRIGSAAGAGFLGGKAGGVFKGLMPIIGGLAAIGAEKAAMQEDIAIRQALMGMNITDTSPEFDEGYARLKALAYEATVGTKYSEAQGAIPMREALPVLAISGMAGVQAAESTYRISLRLGELSELRHKGSIGSEAVAAEEFAHLEQRYEPGPLTKSLDLINAIAMRTDTSIRLQQGIMKYGIPTALSAGIDPDVAAAEMGVAELRLGSTTTAGTGYSRFLLGALHSGGGINAQLAPHQRNEARRAQREFESALRLQPDKDASHDVHAARGSRHDQALVALGVTDRSGKLLDQTATGDLDVEKMKQQVFGFGQTHTKQQALDVIQDAFGTYGGRYASAYLEPGYIDRERAQVATFRGAPSVEAEQLALSHSPLQQFQQMVANFANIGNTLATGTLPGLNTAFGALNTGLIKLNDWLKSHETLATAGGWGALAVGGATALGVLGAGARGLWKMSGASSVWGSLFGGGGEGGLAMEPASGALPAEAGAGGFLNGLRSFISGAPALAYQQYISRLMEDPKNTDPATGAFDIRRAFPLPGAAAARSHSAGDNPEHHTGLSPAVEAARPATVNVTVHNTMNADPGMFEALMAKLTAAVKGALETIGGDAHGSHQSIYMSGGAP